MADIVSVSNLTPEEVSPLLELDGKGKPLVTINNFLQIMEHEKPYSQVYFNLMTGRPEIHSDGKILNWEDADEAESRNFIEQHYRLHNRQKHEDALRIFMRNRAYNPLLNLVEDLKWDGNNRCELFLPEVMRSADTAYTREVSRLIFSGGINRLYSPGCKFDDVPVFIGPQGSGKSTIVNWLALNDDYFCITKLMDGSQKSIEALLGAWIIEIPELSAFKKTDVESLKAFVTARFDKYRLPWGINPSVLPRRCIFIGTGNNPRFLTDKSGNRRFYPVDVHSDGYALYRDEKEIKTFIAQCWAEARERYKAGDMLPYANPALVSEYRAAQAEAQEDDWRIGICEQIAEEAERGQLLCVKGIYHRLYPETLNEPSAKDSREIGEILDNLFQLERVGLQYCKPFGRQRCWQKR